MRSNSAGTTLVAYYLVARYPLLAMLELFAAAFAALAVTQLPLIFLAPRRGRMEFGQRSRGAAIFRRRTISAAAMVLAIITFSCLSFSGSRRRRILAAVGWLAAAWSCSRARSPRRRLPREQSRCTVGVAALAVALAALRRDLAARGDRGRCAR